MVIPTDAWAYQFAGPLYVRAIGGYYERRTKNFKFKQLIISLTYVFVPLAFKSLNRIFQIICMEDLVIIYKREE